MPSSRAVRLAASMGLVLVALLGMVPRASAGPRDYAAIVNRCGAPTLGDTTIYENNTVAGGRKIVKYLRGTLYFNRVGNDGWTFLYGDHDKELHQDASQMAEHMPCITQALADSASADPLPVIRTRQRLEFSAEYHEKLLFGLALLLVALVIAGVVFNRRRRRDDDGEYEG